MENWRGYVNEENDKLILTEEELNELLQEIGALKSFMGRMRGGKKFGEHGYGWEAAVEQWEEEDAQKAAQSLGLSGVDTKEDFVAKVQNTINKAEKSGDERAKEAIKSITGKIEKSAPDEPETPVDEPLAPEVPTPGEVATGETTVWGAINQELAKNDVQLSDEETSALRNMLKDQSKAAGIPLNEATAWEEVKYWVGKAGRLEKGGKIIGRGKAEKENKEKIEKALANPAAKTIAEFKKKLEEEYPDFPNTKETVNYALGLTEIWIVYDSIVAATKKKPSEKGYMAPSAANVLIRALYDLVDRYANYLLADPGEHFDEGKKLDERAWGVPKLRNKAMESSLEAAYGTASETGAAWESVVHELVKEKGPGVMTSARSFRDASDADALLRWAQRQGMNADQLGALARAVGESPEEALRLAQGLADHSAYTGEALSSAAETMINPAAEAAASAAQHAEGRWQDVIANIDFGSGPGGGGPGIDADAAREMQDFFSHGGAAEDLATEFPEWNLGEREVEALTQWNEANTATPEAIRSVRQALEPDVYGSHGSPYQPQPDDPEWLIPDATEPPPSTAAADLQTALQDAGVPDSQASEIVTGNADVTDIQQAVEKLPTDVLEPFKGARTGLRGLRHTAGEPETWLDIYRTGGLDWTDTQAIKDILTSDHPDRIARAVNFAGQEGISADQLGAIARWSGSSGDEAIEIAQALVDHSAYEGAPLTSALESAIEAGPNQWWSPEYTPTGTGVIDDAANQAIDQAAEAVLVPGSDLAPNQQALLDLLKDNDIRSWGPNDSPQGWPQKLLDKGVSAEDVQSMMQDLGLEIPQDVTNSFANNQVSPEALRAVRQAMEPEIYGDPGTPFQPAPNDPEWLIPDSDVPVPDGAGAEMKTALADAGIPDPQAAEMVTGNTPVDAIQQTVEKLPTDALEPFQHAIKGVGATDLAAFQVAGFWLTNVGLPAYAISRVLIKLLRIKGKISSRKKEINKLLQGIDEVPETSGFAGEETNIRELVGKIATIVDADTASALYNQLAKELRRLGYEKMLQQEGLLLLREETIDLSNIKIPPEKRREVGLLLLKSLRPIGADINLGGELLNAAELEPEPSTEKTLATGVDLSAVYTIITDAARADKIAQIIYRVLTSMGVEVIKPSPAEAGDWQAAKMAAENLKKENKVILERWHQLAGIKSTFLSN